MLNDWKDELVQYLKYLLKFRESIGIYCDPNYKHEINKEIINFIEKISSNVDLKDYQLSERYFHFIDDIYLDKVVDLDFFLYSILYLSFISLL